MEKITMKEFEERIKQDEALMVKAKEITGKGEELKAKIDAFAASLGYEIDYDGELVPVSDDEMDRVAGGGDEECNHSYEEVDRHPSIFCEIAVYRCRRCGDLDVRIE